MRPDPPSPAPAAAAAPDEVELVRRVADRDRRAFDLLYRAYYRRLSRFLEQITRRPHLTEEVLNDTMLVVWRRAPTFNGTSRVSTWIFAIAYRKALKALKRHTDASEAADGERVLAAAEGPEAEAIQRESRVQVGRALAALSAEQRAVVEMTYYHGYAYREIAAIVGCPVDTVKTRMFHARRRLKALLGADAESPG